MARGPARRQPGVGPVRRPVEGAAAPGRTRGITGLVYQSIHGVTHWVDVGVQAALRRLEPTLERAGMGAQTAPSPEREALLSALNGVMGDRLAADANPLALPMELRQHGHALDLAALRASGKATGKVLLLVHGLCMSDLGWCRNGHDHGQALAPALGAAPVYAFYNSGLHISHNGLALSRALQTLVDRWPVPLQRLDIVGHSMGGLVARSAVAHAQQAGLGWPAQLTDLVTLGTPHHGAPLERAGHWVDVVLGATPYAAPLARLGKVRSAGITDLRHGLDADVGLPPGPRCWAIAGLLGEGDGKGARGLAPHVLGDGLVRLNSALSPRASIS